MRVGVVADNHRLIDPALAPLLRGVDEIWHAGDLVAPDIIDALRALAPVRVVRGNNDVTGVLRELPEQLLLEREGTRVLLRHIVGKPHRLDREALKSVTALRPDVVVMGHTHVPMAEASDGRVFLNPGSCGPRRFSLPRSAAVMDLEPSRLRFVVTDLDSGSELLDRTFALPPEQQPLDSDQLDLQGPSGRRW
jgi:putative phosphoesterase